MSEKNAAHQAKPVPFLDETFQVRLVSDLKASLAYYRDALGCDVDDWGHAKRGGMRVLLQQAKSRDDVRPNAASINRNDYPAEWDGPDYGWDSFVHISWEDFEIYIEEVRNKCGKIAVEPFLFVAHGRWEVKNVYLQDLDGYTIVLGTMRGLE
ncbi:hypothetical protein DFQ01_11299 [Paenibacillus cellulosilyticus]|uniref:VOC domain-containing protein n=1 Tax=Paenibacillus cellulosilyticus TaxID=375489 RepID=A0A2V2YSA9_9BACL|nr:VOC family protein [Paenibacillus cellulosilyticus]PWW00746.1 hypothetical protein DFQ01_11299 [Paenibacillus cellulosilyticus]QKS45601.1 hypothetical protein HUB94_15050 [Paenibacillus cellulosilyticus]